MTAAMVDRQLAGKVALVTGSTGGIGAAIARRIAGEGAAVILHGFGDSDDIDRLVQELSDASGVAARHFSADMAKPDEIRDLVERIDAELGRIDILVNCAGIQHVSPIEAFSTQAWDDVLAVNLSGPFHTMRLVLPFMRRQGWGRIINIASVSGLISAPDKAAYTAAKHALLGLTKSVALELAQTSITCNAICPGWVLTPLVERQLERRMAQENIGRDEAIARILTKQPAGFVTPEQVAELSLYLMSDRAAQIRGAAMTIDGGYTIA